MQWMECACQTQKLSNCSSNKAEGYDNRAGDITIEAVTYATTMAAMNVDTLTF